MTVYVIGWNEGGPVKIGISKDVRIRLLDLQQACPYELKAFFSRQANGVHRPIEGYSHALLAERAIRSEWFDCSAESAILVVRIAFAAATYDFSDLSVNDLRTVSDCRFFDRFSVLVPCRQGEREFLELTYLVAFRQTFGIPRWPKRKRHMIAAEVECCRCNGMAPFALIDHRGYLRKRGLDGELAH